MFFIKIFKNYKKITFSYIINNNNNKIILGDCICGRCVCGKCKCPNFNFDFDIHKPYLSMY